MSNIYENVNDDGVYNFGRLARVLMTAVRNAPKLAKIEVIEKIKQEVVSNNSFVRAVNESEMPHFWAAVIEQLRISGYLKTKYVPDKNAEEKIMLQLTESGEEWLLSTNEKLELKVAGLMYAFLNKKGDSSCDRSTYSCNGDDSDSDSDVMFVGCNDVDDVVTVSDDDENFEPELKKAKMSMQ